MNKITTRANHGFSKGDGLIIDGRLLRVIAVDSATEMTVDNAPLWWRAWRRIATALSRVRRWIDDVRYRDE